LIVVHHVRKSIGRYEIGSAFRGSSALHAVGDSYLLLTRPSPQFHTVELRFQFRYAAPQPPRLLELDADTLWFSPAGQTAHSGPATVPARRKVERSDITQALTGLGGYVRYNRLRDQIMNLTECSKRTAQLRGVVAVIQSAANVGLHNLAVGLGMCPARFRDHGISKVIECIFEGGFTDFGGVALIDALQVQAPVRGLRNDLADPLTHYILTVLGEMFGAATLAATSCANLAVASRGLLLLHL
jgi:hypothetical protein